jgi:hypothetical protein
MPRVKSLVKKWRIEVAQRARHCKHNRRTIQKGELCLVVTEGTQERSNYCREVALEMVAVARSELESLDRGLN